MSTLGANPSKVMQKTNVKTKYNDRRTFGFNKIWELVGHLIQNDLSPIENRIFVHSLIHNV